MAKYLLPGEALPEPPAANPATTIPRFELGQSAAIFDNLPAPVADKAPRPMEAYDQSRGCILYRTSLPAGPAAELSAREVRDFAWIFLEGKLLGTMDRRSRQYRVPIPERQAVARLDILVEAVGRINFGPELHDRKGLHGSVVLKTAAGAAVEPAVWQVYRLPLDEALLPGLKWRTGKAGGPAFWRGEFDLAKSADTFLDVSTWGKGVLWVNGRCLGRFWNIGPTQTMYVPGPWLKQGRNEVIVLDLLGPQEPVLAGLEKPVLDPLRPQLDLTKKVPQAILTLEGVPPVHAGTFAPGPASQEVGFVKPAPGRQFCLETLSAVDGKPIPHTAWTIAYVDSEERINEDGSALNAINGQTADFWHTEWSQAQPSHPHRLVIDLGQTTVVSGFRYTPRPGNPSVGGRIKDYRVYIAVALAKPVPSP